MLNERGFLTVAVYRVIDRLRDRSGVRCLVVSGGCLYSTFVELTRLYREEGLRGLFRYCKGNGISCSRVDYWGILPDEARGTLDMLPLISITDDEDWGIVSGSFRTWDRVSPIIKGYLPDLRGDTYILLDTLRGDSGRVFVEYDEPYIYINSERACRFIARTKVLKREDCRLAGSIFTYQSQKSVYILEDGVKRHKPSILKDNLYINLDTGLITCDCSDVIGGRCYEECIEEWSRENSIWVVKSSKRKSIMGIKSAN